MDPQGNAWFLAPAAVEFLKWSGVAIIGAFGLKTALDESGIAKGGVVLPSQGKLGDLEEIDAPAHNAPRPGLGEMTDEELLGAIYEPEEGEEVKVKDGKIVDGNGRIKEAKRRGLLGDDDTIPYSEIEGDEPIADWEDNDDDGDGDERDEDPVDTTGWGGIWSSD